MSLGLEDLVRSEVLPKLLGHVGTGVTRCRNDVVD